MRRRIKLLPSEKDVNVFCGILIEKKGLMMSLLTPSIHRDNKKKSKKPLIFDFLKYFSPQRNDYFEVLF